MSKEPNRMSTQDDPENLPWQNSKLELRGVLHPPKPNSPIQFYSESVIPAAWPPSGATVALTGISITSAQGALTAQLGNRGTTTIITPATGSLKLDSLQVDVSENITVTDASNSSVQGETAHHASWIENLSWFIPKEIREPWLGDLLEDRERMENKGCSKLHIEWSTGVQLLYLFLSRLGTRLGWALWIYSRLSEWFHISK